MVELSFAEQISRSLHDAFLYWWAYMPVVLAVSAYQLWMFYQRRKFILGLKWVLLEIIPPPDVPKSPKIAESIFAGLHGVYAGNLDWKKRFFLGTVSNWFSLEIVSNGGDTHFYVRSPEGLRNVVEANIFAQYPDAEIRIADDYITLLPEHLPNDEYDLFCAELIFTKEHAYPIKTWQEFEDAGGKDEHARYDPIAPLMEIMSALRPGEHVWVQYLIRPTAGDWVKEGQAVVDKLAGKAPKESTDPVMAFIGFFVDIFSHIVAEIGGEAFKPAEKIEEKKPEFSLQKLTPSQKLVLEQVELKLSKLAFKAGVRFMYLGRKDVYNMARVNSVTGMYKQLYFNNLNSFKPNPEAVSLDKGLMYWLFPANKGFFHVQRSLRRKKKLYKLYRERLFVKDYVILNTEELATLWHLPGINVQAPMMPRVQAKKGQPPPFLPTK